MPEDTCSSSHSCTITVTREDMLLAVIYISPSTVADRVTSPPLQRISYAPAETDLISPAVILFTLFSSDFVERVSCCQLVMFCSQLLSREPSRRIGIPPKSHTFACRELPHRPDQGHTPASSVTARGEAQQQKKRLATTIHRGSTYIQKPWWRVFDKYCAAATSRRRDR